MRQMVRRERTMAAVAAVLIAAGRAMAQEQEQTPPAEATEPTPERRIVVSIPDRKLALVENGKVVKIHGTAVGAPTTPPERDLHDHQAGAESDVVPRRPGGKAWQEQSGGHALDRSQSEGLRDPRNQRSGIHRAQCVARLHPNAESRRRRIVRAREDRRRGGVARRAG